MKAFLSHSSKDKWFVEQVAKNLEREFVVYDSFSFDHGAEFKTAIIEGLGKSGIFVFFVSQASLESFWVDLELDQARKNLFDQNIAKAIAISLDKTIPHSKLPHWLQRTNVPFIDSPAVAARLIRDHINAQRRESRSELLLGRASDLERIEHALTPTNHRPPGMVALWGLPGIGRRAISKRAVQNIFDLQRSVPITIESGDSVADLRLKLAARFDTPRDSEAYRALQTEIEASTERDNIDECLRFFRKALAGRELLEIVDQGGLLDDEGTLYPDFRNLIRAVYLTEQLKTVIISRRRPAVLELEEGVSLPSVRIDRLSDDSTRLLLQQLQSRSGLTLTSTEIATLADRVKGYPPAAYFAVEIIKEYGKELVLRDAHSIINFRETSFLRLLEKDNKFSDVQRQILGLLPHFDALPLPVLGKSLKTDVSIIDREAVRLLDLALLDINDDGYYFVSDPVREVTHKVFGKLNPPFAEVADAVNGYIKERAIGRNDEEATPLSLLRAQFKAHVLAGRSRKDLFYLTSDIIDVQQTLYHEQDYERSIEYGEQALALRSDQMDALRYIARAQTQLEQYKEAGKTIDAVKKHNLKEARFLEGFLFRKQGRLTDAISAYKDALAKGMRGAAIHRELGHCLLLTNELPDARIHLKEARKADPTNKFVLDLDIQVAIAERRFPEARLSTGTD